MGKIWQIQKPYTIPANYFSEYCKQGEIRWAKLLWIPPNEVHRKTFVVPYVLNT